MYKKYFDIAYAGVSLFFLFTFGIVVAQAQEKQIQCCSPIYFPVIINSQNGFTIEGSVVNPQGSPIPGVTIRTDKGQSAVTDNNGKFALKGLAKGNYTLTPSLAGVVFSPSSAAVVVPPNVTNLNFTAQAQCSEAIVNGGFETNTGWNIPDTSYPAGYSTERYHTGSHSMRTGILNQANNVYSYSDFRQAVQIPSGATVATVHFWLYTLTGETTSLAQAEQVLPTGKPFEQTTLTGDLQYVLILDQDQNWIDTLVWQRTNDGYWHYYEFDLRHYAGDTIYLQFGSYNNGLDGITSMFVDDVSLNNCTSTACQELIVNNKFDLNTGWTILDTAYHAGYSNSEYHSPFRSMRTGIVNTIDNTLSYSDFRQVVTIPSATHHVTLSTWEYFISTGTTSLSEPEQITPTGQPFTETTLSDDLQYLLILDQNQNWIDTLIWRRSNTRVWTSLQFDLSSYAGRTIMLQWGTFNNGTGGSTAMYVDDVNLQACP